MVFDILGRLETNEWLESRQLELVIVSTGIMMAPRALSACKAPGLMI